MSQSPPDQTPPVEVPASTQPDLTPPMTFDFTADFTGQMGSLGDFRFKPLVPIVKGQRYAVSIDRETGATTMEPMAPDPYAGVKKVSAYLWGKFERRRRHDE